MRLTMPTTAAAVALLAAGLAAVASDSQPKSEPAAGAGQAKATFAGGCFWCMEPPYEKVPGVKAVISGYTGGQKKNPTYQEVSAGVTGHTEAVEILYDPAVVSYQQLLDIFWRNIDPTTADRQFCDVGSQYRTGIFYHDEDQRKLAEASKAAVEKTKSFREPVVTEISAAGPFYRAEEYHQDYYLKNPIRYKLYRYNCGRDRRLQQLWGKADH